VKPQASVVLTTYDNPRALELVLCGLARQRVAAFEVWVADDGSRPETGELVRGFATTVPFPVHHVWHEDRGFRKMRILNATVPRVEADYVVLLEGDCIPHPDYVAVHLRWRQPGAFLYGHRVFLDARTSGALRADAVRTGREPGGALRNVVRSFRGRARRGYNALRLPVPALRLSQALLRTGRPVMRGMNFSAWKADLLAINGWNEAYAGWGREDDDLVARLQFHGLRGRSVRFGAILYHLDHPLRRDPAILAANDQIFREVLRRGDPICRRGIRDLDAAPESGTLIANP
jgi:glycosyltransferase involved in cell wall biosynthesis